MEFEVLKGQALAAAIEDLARLRISIFADFPYLYEGSMDYERQYLASYVGSDNAVIVAAREGDFTVGAATGMPLEDHAGALAEPFEASGLDVSQVYYLAESVLMPDFRGRGVGHTFFDLREEHARSIGRKYTVFCSVERPDNDPSRPKDYSPLDPFWEKRGYAKMDGVVAEFDWQDIGQPKPTTKKMQFWMREL